MDENRSCYKKYKQLWFVTKGYATKFVIKRQASRYFYKETRVDKKGHQQYFVTKERETKMYKDTSRSNMILLERDQVILRRDKQQAFVIKQQGCVTRDKSLLQKDSIVAVRGHKSNVQH